MSAKRHLFSGRRRCDALTPGEISGGGHSVFFFQTRMALRRPMIVDRPRARLWKSGTNLLAGLRDSVDPDRGEVADGGDERGGCSDVDPGHAQGCPKANGWAKIGGVSSITASPVSVPLSTPRQCRRPFPVARCIGRKGSVWSAESLASLFLSASRRASTCAVALPASICEAAMSPSKSQCRCPSWQKPRSAPAARSKASPRARRLSRSTTDAVTRPRPAHPRLPVPAGRSFPPER